MTKITFEDRLRLQIVQEQLAASELQLTQSNQLAAEFVKAATINTPWQATFLYDTNTHKALFGERRGGKTHVLAQSGIFQCLSKVFSQVIYIGLNQDSCKRVMYDQVLAYYIRKFNINAKLIGNDEMRFNNGSILYLIGLDANKKQKEKVRGTKASLILQDEMQSYTQDTALIINEVLGPAIADTKASMIIAGTAGNALGKNYWHEITKHNTKQNPIGPSILHPEWYIYRCAWENNTAIDEQTGSRVCDNVRDYLTELQSKHPGIETTPSYRQEWNAEWIVETTALVYRYSSANSITSPTCVELDTSLRIIAPSRAFLQSATYILGIDFGYNHPTAFTTIAYNLSYSNKLYVIETFNKSEMTVNDVLQKLNELDSRYHYTWMVGDGSDLQQFETLRKDYNIPIEKANRHGKLSHIHFLNSDLITRSVIFLPGNDELINQLSSLTWDCKSLERGVYLEDDTATQNDLCDSFLYAHHFSRHFWYEAPKPPIDAATNFTSAILNGEKMLDRKALLTNDKNRLNPYQRKSIVNHR